MKKILLFITLIGLSAPSFAQTCAQTLRLARATYEQGRLHEIAKQLEGCLKSPEDGGFSKEEKQLRVDALKILSLSYIYLEEPQKADEAMLNLKRTDPYYRPNPEVDPAEFVALYNSFREDPIYRIGATLGANFSRPNVSERISVVELYDDSEYKQSVGIQFGISFDLPVTLFKQEDRWTIHTELLYQQVQFETDIKENRSSDPEQPLINAYEGIETQNWISLPATLEYRIADKKYNPYVALGVSVGYRMSSEVTGALTKENKAGVSEKTEDLKPQRELINLSGLAAAGVKFQVGPGLLILELRYAHGLTNISSSETAFNNQFLAFDYGYSDSVFKLSSLSIAGAFIFDVHKPIKLNRKK